MIAARRPPAAMIVNPNAGRLSESVRTEVVESARRRFDLEVFATTARDTGVALARHAAEKGTRLVIAFGGDGHVNEVANGLVGSESVLGIVPGGTMNVFARALGVPLDPQRALSKLRRTVEKPARVVPLGRMNERYFTFSAGVGFDAEAAQRVERYVPAKRRFGEVFFYWSAFRVLLGSYRHRSPSMLLKGPFGEVDVAMTIACNAGPYAYLFGRPVNLAPEVDLEKGLDVFALTSMKIEALPAYAWRAITSDMASHPDAFYAHNQDWFEVYCDDPMDRHVDGEPLPPITHARFEIVRGALKVQV